MKQYQLVISPIGDSGFAAYYKLVDEGLSLPENDEWTVGKTIKEVLKKAKKFEPKDGQVMFTYLNRKTLH